MLQLGFELLAQPRLHQGAEVVHQGVVGAPDRAHPIALHLHQAGALQLAQLAADVRLRKPGGLDQGGHIQGPVLEQTEQLQAGRLAQQAEELAVGLQQLGTGQRAGGGHGQV